MKTLVSTLLVIFSLTMAAAQFQTSPKSIYYDVELAKAINSTQLDYLIIGMPDKKKLQTNLKRAAEHMSVVMAASSEDRQSYIMYRLTNLKASKVITAKEAENFAAYLKAFEDGDFLLMHSYKEKIKKYSSSNFSRRVASYLSPYMINAYPDLSTPFEDAGTLCLWIAMEAGIDLKDADMYSQLGASIGEGLSNIGTALHLGGANSFTEAGTMAAKKGGKKGKGKGKGGKKPTTEEVVEAVETIWKAIKNAFKKKGKKKKSSFMEYPDGSGDVGGGFTLGPYNF